MNDEKSSVYGLSIHSITPDNGTNDIGVYSKIAIEFNSDISPGTLQGNIVVLEDVNRTYKSQDDLNNIKNFVRVKGSISYKDRVVTFVPKETFKTDMGYIVIINDKIMDILNHKLNSKRVSCFYTEKEASFQRVQIVSPMAGIITDEIPLFKWGNVGASSYIFQVAKNNSFEVVVFQEFVTASQEQAIIEHTPIFNITEGLYFVRIRAEGGSWSNLTQFFIKPAVDAVIAPEDSVIDLKEFMSSLEEEIEVLEVFPPIDSVNVSLKLNVMYVKLKGKVDDADIDFSNSWVFGESFDEDDDDIAQGQLNGSWTTVYDEQQNVTYIIFKPDSIEEDVEYLEASNARRIEVH